MELLRDRSDEFTEEGVRVYGVSRDSPWTHIAWSQALDLNFPLLSDWNGEAIAEFAVAHEFRGFDGVAARTAFLVEGDGTVSAAWHYGTNEVPDMDALLAAVRGS
jgi:peroxiredoxin